MTTKRFNPNPILSPRYCPLHEQWEREECGLARTEAGRELVEERERARLRAPFPPGRGETPAPSPTFEQQYPDRELARLRRELAAAQAEIKRLKTPQPQTPKAPQEPEADFL